MTADTVLRSVFTVYTVPYAAYGSKWSDIRDETTR